MVEANRISLIADSGIQFSKPFYLEINPEERLSLSNNSNLQYDFFEWIDSEDNSTRFDLLYHFTKSGNDLYFKAEQMAFWSGTTSASGVFALSASVPE